MARIFRSVFLAALLLSAALTASAQSSRGTVSGLVSDASKSAVADANVELTNQDTKVVRTNKANGEGLYRFDAVDPGNYTIKVTSPGFNTAAIKPFPVAAAQVIAIDVALEVGQVSSTVEVSSAAALLQTEAPVRSATLTAQNIVQLPIASQNPVSLALTIPGVSSNRFSFGRSTFSVNGSRGRSNNFLIDGVDNNDISITGQAFLITNPLAVREVSVQTANFDAEYGRAGGAVVNTITNAGTSQFHGALRYLLDSTIDDAPSNRQKLSAAVRERGHPLPGTDQYFSGVIGGPIVKDRTFFFSAWQEQRQQSTSQVGLNSLTAQGRATLAALYPTGTNANADRLQQVTAGIDANSLRTLQQLGNGRPAIEVGVFQRPLAQRLTDRQLLERIDHSFGSRDQLSGRYLYDKVVQPIGSNTSFIGFDTGNTTTTHTAAITETHTFSPVATNELRLSYYRFQYDSPNDATSPLAQRADFPTVNIPGAISAIGIPGTIPQGRLANNYQIQDTINYVAGKHSFRVGTDLLQQRSRQAAPFNSRGSLTYSPSGSFSSLANYLDDLGGSGGSANRDFGSAFYYPSLIRQAYFAQDRWRATDSLTVTLGVRYEYFGVPVNVLRTPAFTGLFDVDPRTFTGPYNQPNFTYGDLNNFAPTVGLAYSPSFGSGLLGKLFGEKKSTFRIGYQMGYDAFFNNIASNAIASAPNNSSTSTPSQTSTANPRGVANLSTLIPTAARAVTPLDSQTLVSQNLRNPYTQRWSATIQRELPGRIILDVAYVGSKGTRLYANEDLNPLVPTALQIYPAGFSAANIPSTRRQARLDPLQGARTIRTNGGDSNYHAGQLNLIRRFDQGFSFTLAYTRSKLIDNVSDIFNTPGNNLPSTTSLPTYFGGLQNDRSVSLYDRPNRLSITSVYDLPLYKGQKGLLGQILGGWQISGIYTIESGAPLNVLNGQGTSGLGVGATVDRPNFNPAGRPGVRAQVNSSSPTGYVNPDAGNAPINPSQAQYVGVAPCTSTTTPCPTGNLGRFTARTPGINNLDMTISKRFRITERTALEFRAESYNLANHRQYGVAGVSPFSDGTLTIPANISNSQPGQFLNPGIADGGSRSLRYQVKFSF